MKSRRDAETEKKQKVEKPKEESKETTTVCLSFNVFISYSLYEFGFLSFFLFCFVLFFTK